MVLNFKLKQDWSRLCELIRDTYSGKTISYKTLHGNLLLSTESTSSVLCSVTYPVTQALDFFSFPSCAISSQILSAMLLNTSWICQSLLPFHDDLSPGLLLHREQYGVITSVLSNTLHFPLKWLPPFYEYILQHSCRNIRLLRCW